MKKLLMLLLSLSVTAGVLSACFSVGPASDSSSTQSVASSESAKESSSYVEKEVYFKVTFKQNGQSDVVKEVKKGESLAASEIPAPVAKTGYTVVWSETDFTNITDNMTVLAKETAKTYTLTLNADGGTLDETSKQVTYDAQYSLPTPTKTGYTFAGWKKGNADVATSGTWNTDEANVTLTATWTAKEYTVTLNANGGTGSPESVKATFGVAPTVTAPTKTGYNFVGWKNGAEVVDVTAAWNIANDVTLVAEWQAKSYTVTLNADGGTGSPATVDVTYGQAFSVTAPTKTDYNFLNWKYENKTVYNGYVWDIDANDVTLVAQWQEIIPDTCKITFQEQGQPDQERTVNAGSALTDIPTPVGKTGYNTVWSVTDFSNVTNNLTVTAIHTPKQYQVTFNSNGGSDVTAQTIEFDDAYDLTTPTKTGYQFDGWYTADEQKVDTQADEWKLDGGATIELTAKWKAKTYTVTLNLDNGVGATSADVTFGVVPTITAPTKTGYEFTGWKYGNETVNVSEAWNIDGENITLTAQWQAKTCNVTLDLAGGSGATSAVATYGQLLSITAPTKTGYSFDYWKDAEGNVVDLSQVWSVDAATATLTAVWKVKTYTVTLNVVKEGATCAVETISVTYGDAYALPAPTHEDGEFVTWKYGDADVALEGTWDIDVAGNTIELTATWKGATWIGPY